MDAVDICFWSDKSYLWFHLYFYRSVSDKTHMSPSNVLDPHRITESQNHRITE